MAKFAHLFKLRTAEKPLEQEDVDQERGLATVIAESAVEFASSRYYTRLLTHLESMLSSAFKEMREAKDVAAGRAAGIQEVKEFIRLDIERAKKVLNG